LRREKRGYYVGTFHLICEDASKTEENEVTNKYFTLLEKNIKEEPYLWLWTHKRWKRTRQGHIEREKRRAQDLQRLKEKS
jgi:KDO2-lipid IV(A) lauroyltransferase